MPAIQYTKTATSDAAWDGPANEANLKNDGDEAYYKQAFAWQDPDKSGDTKDSFRFIHHEVGSDGDVGAANLAACSTGIGVLNGGRGGTTIPEEDKAGVHAHLAHHLEDAGREAPELKSAQVSLTGGRPRGRDRALVGLDRQERTARGQIEVRATANGELKIVGYAAVFNSPTVINDWWDEYAEMVMPGAFTKTITEGDCRCLWNHDPNYVLGRTKSGTLVLAEDDHGLHYECTPPDTNWARDLTETIRRGDVDGSSFGFRVIRDRWGSMPDPMDDGDEPEVMDCRNLLEVQLYDVSPVAFPAYPQTDSSVRAALAGAGFDIDSLARVAMRSQRGLPLANRDRDQVRAAIDYLRRFLPSESLAAPSAPARSGHPPTPQSAAPAHSSYAVRSLKERLQRIATAE